VPVATFARMRATAGRISGWWRAHPLGADAVTAAFLTGLAWVSLYVSWELNRLSGTPDTIPAWWAATWTALVTLPFAGRRRWPNASFAATTAAFIPYRIWVVPEYTVTAITFFVGMASVGIHGPPVWRDRVRVAALGGVAVALAVSFFEDVPPEYRDIVSASIAFGIVYNVIFVGAAWLLGDALRRRSEREALLVQRTTELVERTAELERERETNERRAVVDERVRIARELHDVVAHHVSVMGVQAGAARRVLGRRPERAAEALTVVEESSRQAVAELHRLVGFLRAGDEAESRAPQPGLARLGELVEENRLAGLAVAVELEGEPRPVPASVDLSAFRVVQEALTNTRKHADVDRAAVAVRYGTDLLEVEVVDHGLGSAATRERPGGHGLVGMRERAALHGGTLDAQPLPDGGYRVVARFPLRAVPA
jgi:signal transduction histidine kinase